MKGWPGEPDMDYDVLVADGEAAANAGKPITDVIFDFGNVLIDVYKRQSSSWVAACCA